jgi:hypothetical protein
MYPENNFTPQVISRINCIQQIITELSKNLTKLNKHTFNKDNIKKILLKIIYKKSTVIEKSFSFLIQRSDINILVSWNKVTKSFDVDISSAYEPTHKVNTFVEHYIKSDLLDKASFDKLAVLFANIDFSVTDSKGKVKNIILEPKIISLSQRTREVAQIQQPLSHIVSYTGDVKSGSTNGVFIVVNPESDGGAGVAGFGDGFVGPSW